MWYSMNGTLKNEMLNPTFQVLDLTFSKGSRSDNLLNVNLTFQKMLQNLTL